ncbi:uncharacterized protein LOC117178159 [Belonocnema kinseyi]|uniref:uncharacterized protein LOC117178159 n=1 Tax=Belonocnema kinseyi TaxID=2817044 RepID=UPI00143DFA13|nr:uncharacterized protein LOC117178159 [Belonocnema kinseyi]XP_033225322.1 uncharacterized protein LOC117178159 [Belonocnema kinseyi]XP_033225323.1 uncharacterized protein LOC117178159 [Belonocnema kinseyi]XP_033225324.1 uncharacterized protein LOC117178159 [Belonocnema kinseyi]XP_033225326.1 uncharacterized protein LOC117178159 [Belonocnema kinseyi]XP_033225327.1 uncharacterized protein LOC117178159 [Belonocnema kinseyi]
MKIRGSGISLLTVGMRSDSMGDYGAAEVRKRRDARYNVRKVLRRYPRWARKTLQGWPTALPTQRGPRPATVNQENVQNIGSHSESIYINRSSGTRVRRRFWSALGMLDQMLRASNLQNYAAIYSLPILHSLLVPLSPNCAVSYSGLFRLPSSRHLNLHSSLLLFSSTPPT